MVAIKKMSFSGKQSTEVGIPVKRLCIVSRIFVTLIEMAGYIERGEILEGVYTPEHDTL